MEDKLLDLKQPLISVRRLSASLEAENKKKPGHLHPKIPHLPVCKFELKADPIRNPGSVPFLWEQTPGQPKEEGKFHALSNERPPVAPKLPPRKISNIKDHVLEEGYESGRISVLYSRAGNDFSEDGSDALDTVSWTESLFYNCSITGVNGQDEVEFKPSGTFSTDQWTRDFMMGRFLPAAKAIASKDHQCINLKQLVTQEKPRKVQRIFNEDAGPLPKQYIQNCQEHSLGYYLGLPFSQAPPKSPSWLQRTLPTISSRNLSTWSCFGRSDYPRIQTFYFEDSPY